MTTAVARSTLGRSGGAGTAALTSAYGVELLAAGPRLAWSRARTAKPHRQRRARCPGPRRASNVWLKVRPNDSFVTTVSLKDYDPGVLP
jgi:hypothetical protein